MGVVVQKYGGSSVTDLERLRKVADRVALTRRAGHDVVVVVSAMGNTTNELLELARQISADPERRELDMLISVGERISMSLLAMALGELGIGARSLTGSQSGIITDEAHSDARVVEVRADRVRSVLDSGRVAIVAGFQGVSREREVTTLGRGGSDTTAVVLAAALDAEWCEICSDVDGVWSADPRTVSGAKKLDELSLDEALAMARGGAKVLFEDAVRFARDNGVEIRTKATFGPGSGTRLRPAKRNEGVAVAVSGDDKLVRLRLGSLERSVALTKLRDAGVRFRRRVGELLFVDVRNVHGTDLGRLHRSIHVEGPTAFVTAVGSGLAEHIELVERGSEALLDEGHWIVRHGAGGDEAWWEVEPASLEKAVLAVHATMVQGEPTALEREAADEE
jgi:aspartate kinase